MAAKDRCQVCGRPSVGRFCYRHLGEALDKLRRLCEQDHGAWQSAVDTANEQANQQYHHPPEETKGE
jgi:hypothetical protein